MRRLMSPAALTGQFSTANAPGALSRVQHANALTGRADDRRAQQRPSINFWNMSFIDQRLRNSGRMLVASPPPSWQLPVTESIALPPDRGEASCLSSDHLAPCAKSQPCWHASPQVHRALTSGRSNAPRAVTCISARASLSIR
jgi:hypothetical protein